MTDLQEQSKETIVDLFNEQAKKPAGKDALLKKPIKTCSTMTETETKNEGIQNWQNLYTLSQETQISFYSKCYEPAEQTQITLREFIEQIKNNKDLKKHTDYLRQEKDKEKRIEYKKKNLSAVTLAGTFSYRENDCLIKPSGLSCIDIDIKESIQQNIQQIKQEVMKDKHVVFVILSPSGGLKIAVKIPLVENDSEYKIVYAQLLEYFKKYSPTQDTQTKDISRLCFLSYDPDIYVNWNAEEFPVNWDIKLSAITSNTTDAELLKLLEGDQDAMLLYNGVWEGSFESRSEAEQSLVDRLVSLGLGKEQVFKVMASCKLGKWQEANIGYREMTYNKAIQFVNEGKKKDEAVTPEIIAPLKESNKSDVLVNSFAKEIANITMARVSTEREWIEIPQIGNLISSFAEALADIFSERRILFFRKSTMSVVEIRNIIHKNEIDEIEVNEFLGFAELTSSRFVSLIEGYVIPYTFKKNDNNGKLEQKRKSVSSQTAKVVIDSSQFQDKLPHIERIFNVPIPVILKGDLLTFPMKGYDEWLHSWTPLDAPEINPNISLDKAKEIIEDIFSEFCFEPNTNSKVNAIAALLTPFLRGLYPAFNTRTPIFFYKGNRERAGKDYCAGITGILYEGCPLEEPPVSVGGRHSVQGQSDELRKKILAALMAGRKRLHFANNKGIIDNPVFEGIATSKRFNDRILGSNKEAAFDNELEFSLSGNTNIAYTADFANRCRFINLFLEIEDANARIFKKPDLQDWVLKNRSLILSALYAIVRNWDEQGRPKGKTPFASFPEWAAICGGIMTAAGFDDPCKRDTSDLFDIGDTETLGMKMLFELCYDKYHNKETDEDKWITKKDIEGIVKEQKEERFFAQFDLENVRADQTRFGLLLQRYINRIMSDIKLLSLGKKARDKKYIFTKTPHKLPTLPEPEKTKEEVVK